MTIHLPPQAALADTQSRIAPKLGVNGHDEISALKLAVPIVRRWPLIVASALIVGALAVAFTFLVSARYTARTSFTVEASTGSLSMPKGLVGIAGQLGMVLGGNGSAEPPAEYFTALATSWTIRRSLLDARFTADGEYTPTGGAPLLTLLRVKGDNEARRVEAGIRQLGRMLHTEIDRRAGIVTIMVTDREAERAASIANHLMTLLNKYNVEQRRSRSRQQREFAERSLREAQGELRAAESRLQEFLTSNRRYQQSPLLLFEYNRLDRTVAQKQTVVEGLAQSYEEARISEAGDIPVISVVDVAVPPAWRSFPVRWQFLLGGLLLGGIVGLIVAYLLEAKRTWVAEQQPDFIALRDAARLWRARLRGQPIRG
jgi:uncharacterized protein involved in exopolysaccharide biosynthesis